MLKEEIMLKVGDRFIILEWDTIGACDSDVTIGKEYQAHEDKNNVVLFKDDVGDERSVGFAIKYKLTKNGKAIKQKPPTHIVIWTEDTDPMTYHSSLEDAKTKIKELSENSDVKDIVLVTIKKIQSIKVTKNIRFLAYKQ